jgi:hypothetical protein
LPPGRTRLATSPPPTGSIVVTNTIGTVRLACCKSATIEADREFGRYRGSGTTLMNFDKLACKTRGLGGWTPRLIRPEA